MKLFTFEIAAHDDRCVDLPGFSHRGQPRKKYPTDTREIRTVYFYAKHRRQAGQHVTRYCGITTPCNLSEGQKADSTLTPAIAARVEAS